MLSSQWSAEERTEAPLHTLATMTDVRTCRTMLPEALTAMHAMSTRPASSARPDQPGCCMMVEERLLQGGGVWHLLVLR